MIKKEVIRINNEYADIWLTYEIREDVNYCYGGTRSVSYKASDEEAERLLDYLGCYESGVKNLLINQAIREGVFEKFNDSMPNGFSDSQVGGGRCVFRPKTESIENIIMNPNGNMFMKVISSILKSVGSELNRLNGVLKLTPDFGRFAGVADVLHQYTENVLGICCENGGCGGKASYTSTGINAAIDYFLTIKGKEASIILIGSDGACGDGVFKYILDKKYNLAGVSDLVYSDKVIQEIPVLKAAKGKFTDECLSNADIIVATTVGSEFLNSNINAIKPGTIVLLAHNDCLPVNRNSVEILEKLRKRNITVVPGQMLTFGGALTSRIEWFWRQNFEQKYFNKQLAHDAVYQMMWRTMEKYYSKGYKDIPFEKIVNMF